MKDNKYIQSFNEHQENLDSETLDKSSSISDVSDSIKDRNVYVYLGRYIKGNWDDGYEFEGTLEDLSEFTSNIISGLSDDEKNYIISNL
jgi:hypothetical protein